MKIRIVIVLSTLLLSLSVSAQIAQQPMRSTSPMLNERTTPQATTTATGFRAISTTPTIGMDGQAVQPGMVMYSLNNAEDTPDNPNVDPDKDKPNGYPIGDSVLPLLLFSSVYAFFRLRKESHRKNSLTA